MSMTTDTRAISLVDIPLVRRLTSTGTVLDSELGVTRDVCEPNGLILSSLLFPRGVHTLIARSEQQPVIGQFRHRSDDVTAHIVFLAPAFDENSDATAWLHILDAMAREAGKQGAHALIAEVDATSPLFETLRQARFATYARQHLWRHAPFQNTDANMSISLREEQNSDQVGIMSLIANTVPTMLQQIAAPHSDMQGLVYNDNDGHISAYIGVTEGAQGVYLLPIIHPDERSHAAAIITAAMDAVDSTTKVPVYTCVRSYQQWLNEIMRKLGFEQSTEQAVMVKQIAAGIRQPSFAKVRWQGQLETQTMYIHGSWSTVLDEYRNQDEELV